MLTRRETQIASITTLIQQLYLLIPPYNNTFQHMLRDFCNVFKPISAQKPIIYQSEFKERLKEFDKKNRFTKIYYKLAFLWFACDFVALVHKYLILRKKSLGFIHKILREVFKLVEKQIPLESVPEWEKLQYECKKNIVPLLHTHYKNETKIFNRLNSLIDECGLGSLNPKRIQKAVWSSLRGPPWRPTQEVQIQTFFDLTQIVWDLHFYPEAFLLSRVFIYLRVKKSKEFKKYQRVFSSSDIQVSRTALVSEGSKEFFIGRQIIPQKSFDDFMNFLLIGEDQEIFEIVEYQKVVDFKHTVSYAFYKAGIGWSFQTKQFKNITKNKIPLNCIEPVYFETLKKTNPWNPDWSCTSSRKTEQFIRTMCRFWRAYSFEDLYNLAGHIHLNQDRTKLFKPHNKFLRELLKKNVFQIMITPWGLIRSYSINSYLVIPPRTVSKEDLENILIILPFALSFELHNGNVRIFCYMDKILVDFIRNNLKWRVLLRRQSIAQYNLNPSDFDLDSYSWKKLRLKEERQSKLNF